MPNLLEIINRTMRLRNYSPRTIKTYSSVVKDIYWYCKKPFRTLTTNEIEQYLEHKLKQGCSSTTISLYIQVINYVMLNIYKRTDYVPIQHPKRASKLPVVLSRQEIQQVINCTVNQKHKTILALAYGAGLRVSEVVDLKVQDINIAELTIHIKQAKGKKDRITILPEKLIIELQYFMDKKDKNDFVFSSERGGKLTTRTAQKVFENSLKKSDIKKPATFHSLRHSFATHLLENGVDVRYIQELLGHNNIRTTQRYTQVTRLKLKNIKSPF